jgi:hypothetical protein
MRGAFCRAALRFRIFLDLHALFFLPSLFLPIFRRSFLRCFFVIFCPRVFSARAAHASRKLPDLAHFLHTAARLGIVWG